MTGPSTADPTQRTSGASSLSTPSTVAVAVTLTTVGVLPVFLVGSLAVQIRQDLGLSRTGLGLAVSAFFATAALTSVFAGRIVNRLGAAATMEVAALYQAAMGVVIALAAGSPVLLVVLLGIAGFGNGAMQPAVNLFLSDRVTSTRQGLAFGIKQAAIPVATLLGGLAVPVIALTIGWRYGFGGAAALALAGWWIVPRDAGPDATRWDAVAARFHRGSTFESVEVDIGAPDTGTAGAGSPAAPDTGTAGAGSAVASDTGRAGAGSAVASDTGRAVAGQAPTQVGLIPPEPPAVAHRALVVLAIGIALGSGAANGLGAFLVTSAVDIGFRPGIAGLLAALGSVVGLTTRIGTGAMADRRTFHQFRVVVVMLAVGAVGYLGLATGARWLFIPATVVAYGAGWGWNGLFNYTVVRTHPGAVAQATGLTQAGVYVGGIVGPLGIGILLGHVSFSVVWTVVAAAALAAAITILVGRRMMVRWLGDRSDRSDLSVFT